MSVIRTDIGVSNGCPLSSSSLRVLIDIPLLTEPAEKVSRLLVLFGGMEVVRKEAKDNPSASANLLSKIFFW